MKLEGFEHFMMKKDSETILNSKTGRILSGFLNGKSRMMRLQVGDKYFKSTLARLKCQTFIPYDIPSGKWITLHKDQNPLNNRLDNLKPVSIHSARFTSRKSSYSTINIECKKHGEIIHSFGSLRETTKSVGIGIKMLKSILNSKKTWNGMTFTSNNLTDLTDEIWKDCNLPKFKGLKWSNKGRIMKNNIRTFGVLNFDGYMAISLSTKKYLIHRIIASEVFGEMPDLEVDHLNGKRYDNRPENLKWVTPKENYNTKYINCIKNNDLKGEIWTSCKLPEFKGLKWSNKGRILHKFKTSGGHYGRFNLNRKSLSVPRVILLELTFNNENLKRHYLNSLKSYNMYVKHINGDNEDHRPENLQWKCIRRKKRKFKEI